MSATTPARLPAGLPSGPLLRRYTVLCGYLIGLFGWAVAMPLFGSVGRAWAEGHGGALAFPALPLWWLGGHAIALVVWGMLWDRRPGAAGVGLGAQCAAAVNAMLTVLLLWRGLPLAAWPVIFVLMGAATAVGLTAWGRWYATTVPVGGLGRVFSVAAAGIGLTKWLFAVLAAVLGPVQLMVLTLLPLMIAILAAQRVDQTVDQSRAAAVAPDRSMLWSAARTALLIIVFSVVADLSYRVMVMGPPVHDSLRHLPYIVGVLAAGALVDRRRLLWPIAMGSGLLALACLIGAWGGAPAHSVGVALNGLSSGLMAPATWLLLAVHATPATAGRWFGWGLNLTMLPLAIGSLLPLPFGQPSAEQLGLFAALAMLLVIVSLHGVVRPLERLRREGQGLREAEAGALAAALAVSAQMAIAPVRMTGDPASSAPPIGDAIPVLLARRYGTLLSGRELEIASLAVLGGSTRDVAQQLFISENTVKTHLRNIFRKTGSANRHDLYRRLVEEDRG